jgi:glycerol-3-phosphate acyltransferase PlsY
MDTAALILVSYLIGSLPFAVIMSRALGLPDPRTYGSGNPGATNVLRTGRKIAALLTLAGDGGKGWLAVFLAARYGMVGIGVAACALAVFLGHLFPVFLGFKGGKGVATAAGVLFAFDPRLGLAAGATWVVVALVFRYASLASIVAAILAPACAYFMSAPPSVVLALALIGVLIVWRHKANILNLAARKERKIGQKEAKAEDPGGGERTGAEKS